MKATASAPANNALIKYWGRKDEEQRLPANGSISINLSELKTVTTVEFSSDYKEDRVIIGGEEGGKKAERVIKHLDRIRSLAGISDHAKVVSENKFPSDTGLSSSSSAFAALSLAGAKAAGLDLSEKELSILARQGSGSACRSIPDGWTEWLDSDSSETSYAESIFPPDHWDVCDLVALVSTEKKHTTSSRGHTSADTSPFMNQRISGIPDKINRIKQLIKEKNFSEFGKLVEAEALELHSIMMTQDPPLLYWLPGTVKVMRAVQEWREEGIPVFFTVNTGQDIHILCENKDQEIIKKKLSEMECVREVIVNKVCEGARLSDDHLF